MKRQIQFETPRESKRYIKTAVRDAAFHIVIIILSGLAIAGMAWLYFNGAKVDSHINHIIK